MLYKTKNGQQTGFVPGVGRIVNGQIEGPDNLESANLVPILPEKKQEVIQPQIAPAAAAVSPNVDISQATPTASAQPVQNTNITNMEAK